MKTLTYAYYTPTEPIGLLGLVRRYTFIEYDVPCDLPFDDAVLNEHIAKAEQIFQSPELKFVVIPERYRHLDASVILKYVSSLEKELPPSEWDIKTDTNSPKE